MDEITLSLSFSWLLMVVILYIDVSSAILVAVSQAWDFWGPQKKQFIVNFGMDAGMKNISYFFHQPLFADRKECKIVRKKIAIKHCQYI